MLNTEACQKVRDMLQDEQVRSHFYMGSWWGYADDKLSLDEFNELGLDGCETVGCVAGHIVHRFRPEVVKALESQPEIVGEAIPAAIVDFDPGLASRVWMGLSHNEANYLFHQACHTYGPAGADFAIERLDEILALNGS